MTKNITFSLDEQIIRKARIKATQEHRTLNDAFRSWITSYVGIGRQARDYREIKDRLAYANAGRKFTREEMNER